MGPFGQATAGDLDSKHSKQRAADLVEDDGPSKVTTCVVKHEPSTNMVDVIKLLGIDENFSEVAVDLDPGDAPKPLPAPKPKAAPAPDGNFDFLADLDKVSSGPARKKPRVAEGDFDLEEALGQALEEEAAAYDELIVMFKGGGLGLERRG